MNPATHQFGFQGSRTNLLRPERGGSRGRRLTDAYSELRGEIKEIVPDQKIPIGRGFESEPPTLGERGAGGLRAKGVSVIGRMAYGMANGRI